MDAKPVPFQVTRRGTNSFSVTFPETPICTKEQNLPVRDILRDNWQSFAKDHNYSPHQEIVAMRMAGCKTGAFGYTISACPNCGDVVCYASSCGDRNCPSCQLAKQLKWKERRASEIIPGVPYYHIVFTAPHELLPLFQANVKVASSLYFAAVAETLRGLLMDSKYLGAEPAILLTLHTWNQRLSPHWHVHALVSGAGLTKEGELRVLPTPKDSKDAPPFLIPERVLSARFRTLFVRALNKFYKKGDLYFPDSIAELKDPNNWHSFSEKLFKKKWVSHVAGSCPDDTHVVEYLARYIFRTAVSNSRVEYDGKMVTLHYKVKNEETGRRDRNRVEVMTPEEFINRLISHILPKGVQRTRGYGLWSNSSKKEKLAIAFEKAGSSFHVSAVTSLHVLQVLRKKHPDLGLCPSCKSELKVVGRSHPGDTSFSGAIPSPQRNVPLLS